MGRLLNTRALVVATVVLLLAATFFLVRTDDKRLTVTAYLPQAVAVYEQTPVKILGVKVGEVTEVEPAGDSVRVEMEYAAKYEVPKDAKAVVIKPGLVSSRFIQLTPAYTGGPVMKDGAVIPLSHTDVPVKLDRIYESLKTLAQTLGPNGVNKNGTLNHLLSVAADALDGKGRLGNRALKKLSRAAQTIGSNTGELFDTVEQLAQFTEVLAKNDSLVRAFLKDLAEVSKQLSQERVELRKALAEVAGAVREVRNFVRSNRAGITEAVERLTKTMKTIASERKSLDTTLRVAPVAIGNLQLAFNAETGTIGSRITLGPNIADLDGFLCRLVQRMTMSKGLTNLACTLFSTLLEAGQPGGGQLTLSKLKQRLRHPKQAMAVVREGGLDPRIPSQPRFAPTTNGTLTTLIGGRER